MSSGEPKESKSKAKPNHVDHRKDVAPSKAGRRVLQVLAEELEVPMTEKEVAEEVDNLLAQLGEEEVHEAHAEDVKAELKAREKSIRANIQALRRRVNRKTNIKTVKVHVEADFDAGVAYYLRQDTGAEVRTRPLQEEDRQLPIDGVATETTIENPFA